MSLHWLQLQSSVKWSILAFHLFISVPSFSFLIVGNLTPLSSKYLLICSASWISPVSLPRRSSSWPVLLTQTFMLWLSFSPGAGGSLLVALLYPICSVINVISKEFFFFGRPREFSSSMCSCWLWSLSVTDRWVTCHSECWAFLPQVLLLGYRWKSIDEGVGIMMPLLMWS